jgi:hypothetical protein
VANRSNLAIADQLMRRRVLQVGTLGLVGLDLPKLLYADTARQSIAATADACVLLFLNGGPSQLDTWDMKPDAPAEIRGEFKPIPSSLPSVPVCEYLPRLANRMHHCALVRSVRHSVNNAHAAAVYAALTGHDRGDAQIAIGAGPDDYPAIGAVTALMRPPKQRVVSFVSMPYMTKEGAGGPPQPGFFGGWLGRAHDPLFVLRDPNALDFAIPELALAPEVSSERFDARRALLEDVNRQLAAETASLRTMNEFQAQAYELLRSPASQRAFEITREPATVRDAYGRNIYGQSTLLARRLIEAGTRVVTISWAPDANATWDTHGQNFAKLKNELLPQLDAALSSLLDDLSARGLLERTLVVVMGEFGRTPRINPNAGRDHWNFCYSVLFAGGGIAPGALFGSSDKIGAYPKSNPIGPADIIATIYHCLGIPNELKLRDRLNREMALAPWGEPIRAILT